MRKLFLLLFSSLVYSGDFIETSFSLKNCENSLKKDGGRIYNFLGQKQFDRHILNINYMDILENTYQPPMPKDLEVQKLAFKYRYNLSNGLQIGATYLHIKDNLMPTDGGNMYGISLQSKTTDLYILSTAYYKVVYDDFDVEQVDISVLKKIKTGDFKNSLKAIIKSTYIDGYKNSQFNPKAKLENADDHYLIVGLFLATRYKSYFGKVGGFVGDRLFTVMNNGYMVQHHPMEFGNSLLLAFGKDFGKIRVGLKYNQHTSISLPTNNQNIKFKMGTLTLRYNF